jgi:ribonuclease E
MEEDALKENTVRVIAQVPVEVATFLINEKREALLDIETRHKSRMMILPHPDMVSPHFEIERVKIGDRTAVDQPSYEMITRDVPDLPFTSESKPAADKPAVSMVASQRPAPSPSAMAPAAQPRQHGPGVLSRIWGALFAPIDAAEPVKPDRAVRQQSESRGRGEPGSRQRTARKGSRQRPSDGAGADKPSAQEKRPQKPEGSGNTRSRSGNRSRRGPRQQGRAAADSRGPAEVRTTTDAVAQAPTEEFRKMPAAESQEKTESGADAQSTTAAEQPREKSESRPRRRPRRRSGARRSESASARQRNEPGNPENGGASENQPEAAEAPKAPATANTGPEVPTKTTDAPTTTG